MNTALKNSQKKQTGKSKHFLLFSGFKSQRVNTDPVSGTTSPGPRNFKGQKAEHQISSRGFRISTSSAKIAPESSIVQSKGKVFGYDVDNFPSKNSLDEVLRLE